MNGLLAAGAGEAEPIRAVGCFVAVVGPSGAGKDTLIRGMRERLADDGRFIFARRIVTRRSDSTEDHDSVTAAEFEQLRNSGAFLLSWSANGLSYGLPGGLALEMRNGRSVIANVSRASLPEVRERFRPHLVVHVTASPVVLAARLSARAREDAAAQQARLDRALAQDATVTADVTIDNSDDLPGSLAAFERALLRQAPAAQPGP